VDPADAVSVDEPDLAVRGDDDVVELEVPVQEIGRQQGRHDVADPVGNAADVLAGSVWVLRQGHRRSAFDVDVIELDHPAVASREPPAAANRRRGYTGPPETPGACDLPLRPGESQCDLHEADRRDRPCLERPRLLARPVHEPHGVLAVFLELPNGMSRRSCHGGEDTAAVVTMTPLA